MTQYFVIVIFLSCNLVPKEVDKFTLKVHPPHDHKHKMEVIYEYDAKKKAWIVHPDGDLDDKGIFKIKNTKLLITSPEPEVVDIKDFLNVNGKEDWSEISEIPFQTKLSDQDHQETPIQIIRHIHHKKIVFKQKEGALSKVGVFEIHW